MHKKEIINICIKMKKPRIQKKDFNNIKNKIIFIKNRKQFKFTI